MSARGRDTGRESGEEGTTEGDRGHPWGTEGAEVEDGSMTEDGGVQMGFRGEIGLAETRGRGVRIVWVARMAGSP